jgi:hypothetical protein
MGVAQGDGSWGTLQSKAHSSAKHELKNAGAPVDPFLRHWPKQAEHDQQGSEAGGGGDHQDRHALDAVALGSVGWVLRRSDLNPADGRLQLAGIGSGDVVHQIFTRVSI